MADNGNPEKPRAQIVLTLDHAGRLNVTGPIKDAILCYGMMELAKDVIKTYNAAHRAEPAVMVPQFVPPKGIIP